jgi:hypothetical protein
MKNTVLIVVIAVLSVLLIGFAYVSQDEELCCKYSLCANITKQCEKKEEAKGTEITSEKGVIIKLDNIKEGDTVEVGFEVKGSVTGSWFTEGVFPVRITEKETNSVIITNTARADGEWETEDYVPFSFVIDAEIEEDGIYILRFDKANPSGVSDSYDYASLTVNLKPYKPVEEPQSQETKIFFANVKLNEEASDCKIVYPVSRSLQNIAGIERLAVEELIKGPTEEEKAEGYVSEINPNVKVLGLSIEDGVARVDFSKELEEGVAGSCKVESIRAQIEETLKQFDNINSVVISVEGKAEGILQP